MKIPKDNKINKNLRKLIISHNFFRFGRQFLIIFMNVYIWKLTNDFRVVAFFNLFYYLTHATSFLVFSNFIKKGNIHFPRKAGLVGHIFVFLIIGMLKENIVSYLVFLAIFKGFFSGLYWSSYHVFRFDLSNHKNRGNFIGIEKASKILINIVVPSFGGFVIAMNFGGLGYSNVFFLGAIFFICSFFLGNIDFKPQDLGKFHPIKTLHQLKKHKNILKSLLVGVLANLGRSGPLLVTLLPVLIFNESNSELQLGGWLSFFSILAILTALGIGKFVNHKYYRKFIVIGGLCFVAMVLALIIWPFSLMLFFFGAFSGIFTLFLDIPRRAISDNLIHHMDNYSKHRMEYMAIREFSSIGVGRVLSYVLLLFVVDLSVYQLKYFLLAVIIAVVLETIILFSVKVRASKMPEETNVHSLA